MTARVRGRVVLYFPAKRAGVCPACAQRFSAGTAIYGPRGGPYCHAYGLGACDVLEVEDLELEAGLDPDASYGP
jgi:hypothetical protein